MRNLRGICILVLVFLAVSDGQAELTLKLNVDEKYIAEVGDAAAIECMVDGTITQGDAISYKWYNGKFNETNEDRNYLIENTAYNREQNVNSKVTTTDSREYLALQFELLEEKNAGWYTCIAVINNEKKVVQLLLEIKAKLEITAPSRQFPKEGTNALIRCSVKGTNVRQSFEFRPSGAQTRSVIMRSDKYSYHPTGSLQVTNISKSDSGTYYCVGSQSGSVEEAEILVTVRTPPTWVYKPTDTSAILTYEKEMRCQATAVPQVKYYWAKGQCEGCPDEKELSQDQDKRIFYNADSGILYMKKLEENDQNFYFCRAQSILEGEGVMQEDIEAVAAEALTQKIFLDIIIPANITTLVNVTVKETETAELTCVARGDVPLQIQFKREDLDHPYQSPELTELDTWKTQLSDSRISLRRQQTIDPANNYTSLTLRIVNTRPDDKHNYTCIANNTGSVIGPWVKNGTITVQFKPHFRDSPDIDVQYNWVGQTRNITCKTNAEPHPNTWVWFHRNQVVNNNATYHIYREYEYSNLSVTVSAENVYWVFGQYRCNATNTIGTGSHQITLEQARTPGEPEVLIKDEDVTPTQIILNVQKPTDLGGLPILQYKVRVENIGSQQEVSVNQYDIGETILIKELQPNTNFRFYVSARNEVGYGLEKTIDKRTMQERAPFPIEITTGDSDFGKKYFVSWAEPKDGGSDILYFIINYRKVVVADNSSTKSYKVIEEKSEKIWKKEDKVDKGRRTFTLLNLEPSSTYEVEVLAVNGVGTSKGNPIIFRTKKESVIDKTPATPGEVRDAANSLAVNLGLVTVTLSLLFLK